MMKKNETYEQYNERIAAYELKFGAKNALDRVISDAEHAVAIQAPAVKRLLDEAATRTSAYINPLNMMDLADHLAKNDAIVRRNGVIVNDL